MQDAFSELKQLNADIGVAESKGDRHSREWLGTVVAPELAFFRADGKTIDDRERFLDKVQPSPSRTTHVRSIDLLGNRAVVKCSVTVEAPAGREVYDNVRVFVRMNERWLLLGWANEREQ